MQHLDDGTIHAWLDGALGADHADHAAEHVAACGACADRVAEARGLIAASSRILSALDDVPANVVPAETRVAAAAPAASPAIAAAVPSAAAVAPRPRWWGHRYGRLAAVLAFIVAGTLVITREANRRDDTARHETPRASDEVRARRDSAASRSNAPTAPTAAAPQAVTAPTAALGGAAPRPAPPPALKPQVKSFALQERQQAASAKKSARVTDVPAFGNANTLADSASPATQAQASSTLARRIGEGKPVHLSEVIVTGESIAPTSPRLLSVDSVQRGGTMVRRETYAMRGGTRVELEVTPAPAITKDSGAAAPAGARFDSAAAPDSSSSTIHTIRWRGADGTGYTLSGPVSIDELWRIRAALGKGP